MGQRSNEFVECQKTEGIHDQWLASGRRHLSAGRRPVGPLSCHGEAAQIMVPQAQSLDAGDPSDLQNNKPLTMKWMKRMSYLSRTQRLMEQKCSSM